ncbi:hypothetical protein [Sphingobium sp. SYK-6]|nr:hypothetical protein [Sphingobium sp. SYK-6]
MKKMRGKRAGHEPEQAAQREQKRFGVVRDLGGLAAYGAAP